MTAVDIDQTLAERKLQHGDFTDHARIAQRLKESMWDQSGWEKLTDTQKEGLEMIQHKIARILAGDPKYPDHWADIEGYARITRQRIK